MRRDWPDPAGSMRNRDARIVPLMPPTGVPSGCSIEVETKTQVPFGRSVLHDLYEYDKGDWLLILDSQLYILPQLFESRFNILIVQMNYSHTFKMIFPYLVTKVMYLNCFYMSLSYCNKTLQLDKHTVFPVRVG